MSDFLSQAKQDAARIRAGGSLGSSQLLGQAEADAAFLRSREELKRSLMYSVPVSEDQLDLISQHLAASSNPEDERWNMASSLMYAHRLGLDMETARTNLESMSKSFLHNPQSMNGKSHFEAIADSFRVGDLTMQASDLIGRWKDSGGTDTALERQIDGLYDQIDKLQDKFPSSVMKDMYEAVGQRAPFLVGFGREVGKAVAQSAPFTGRVAGQALLGAGAATVAIGALGGMAATEGILAPALAPAAAAAMKAAAAGASGFMASMQATANLDYWDMRKQGVPHNIANSVSLIDGGIQATIESALGNTAGLVSKIGGEAVTNLSGKIAKRLMISGKMGAFARAITGYAGEVVEEGTEEALQQIVSDVSKNVAAGLTDKGIPQMDAEAIAKDAAENFKAGAMASLGMGLPGSFIGYKNAARESKALKSFAAVTDKETFISSASKWDALQEVPEARRKEALAEIWKGSQKKVAKSEAAIPMEQRAPVKDFARTEAGTLYTEQKTIDEAEDGRKEAILKVGDAKDKTLLGHLLFTIDPEEGITLKSSQFQKGYEGLREEAIQELAARYPGMAVKASESTDERTKAAVDRLAAQNPHGQDKGAQWFTEGDNVEDTRAKQRLRIAIADKMPNVTAPQREAAILIHEFRANAMGQDFASYVRNEFQGEIISDKEGMVSAAQGNRAGIKFTKDGADLAIGQFVKDAKALIMVTEKSDFVSFVHESGHLFRKQLIGTDLGAQLDDAYGVIGGTWTRDHEEQFANDLTKYLTYGEVKDERLKGVFQRIAQWITKLYNTVLAKQSDVDPRVRAVMDQLFVSDKSPIAEAARTEAVAEDAQAQTDAKAVQPGANDKTLFQYVGERAILSDEERANLSVAREMDQGGNDSETIRLATGWFKGKYDGKWRLETPDIKWKKAGEEQTASLLGDAISAPKLFAKYPELKKATLSYGPSSEGMMKKENARGRYKQGSFGPFIAVDSSLKGYDALRTFTHEIQHAIQDIEGFAQGSTPGQFEQSLMDQHKYKLYSDANILSVMLRGSTVNGDIDKALALFEKRMKREPELGATEAAMDLSTEQIRDFRGQYAWRDPMTQYTRTAGEIEARDVASRMGLSPEQRLHIAPYSSEDIAPGDAVVLFQPSPPTDSEAFKKWFGNSKVVDDNGNPLVVYHGNNTPVSIFNTNISNENGVIGIFFTDNEQNALEYGDNITRAYLNISNPYKVTNHDWMIGNGISPVEAKISGYDGYLIKGQDGADTYIAFYPNQIKSTNNQGTWDANDPRILYQADEATILDEASGYDTWESWKADVEASADFLGDQSSKPEGLTGAEADAWYKAKWEEAHSAPKPVAATSRRGDFTASMAKKGGVEKFLSAIWDAEVRAYDPTAAMDAEEQAQLEASHDWRAELERRLKSHPLVLLAAQSVGQGKRLSGKTRATILTYIRNNETEFKGLYADLTADEGMKQEVAQARARLTEIADPKLSRYTDMSIAERTALLNRISDQGVKARLQSGEYGDAELTDYVRRLDEERKTLQGKVSAAEAEIQNLGGKLEIEENYSAKVRERARLATRSAEDAQKALAKSQAVAAKLDEARAAYKEALDSAKGENRLGVKVAREDLIDALKSARQEAALQTRMKADEIRAAYRLREQRDALRKAIMRPPAKNIAWAQKQEIRAIQAYLKSKRWQYIEEDDGLGGKKRKRAYETITVDGKEKKVPVYTSDEVDTLKARMGQLFRESPNLAKYITQGLVDRINDKPVSAWTVAELKELQKAMKNIADLGKTLQDIKKLNENTERMIAGFKVSGTVREGKYYQKPFGHGSEEQKKLLKDFTKSRLTVELPFVKMSQFSEVYLDNGAKGASYDLLVAEERSHYTAKMREVDRRQGKIFTRMKELKVTEKSLAKRETIAGVGPGSTDFTVSHNDLMAIRLALRDPDSKAAFIYGNLFSNDERIRGDQKWLQAEGNRKLTAIEDAVELHLSAEEKEIADMIGQDFDGEFDRLNKAVIDLTNEEMKKVAHYFPIHREGVYFEKFGDKIMDALATEYGMTNLPSSGFTLERVKIGDKHQTPIKLDLMGIWGSAVDRQEHLVAYGAYIKKLNSVYKSRQAGGVREAIIQSFGKAGMDYVDKYISEIANPGAMKAHDPSDKAVRLLRGNMAVGYLAFRWTSVVKQLITSPLPYMAYAPKGTLGSAVSLLTSGHPLKWLAQVEGQSEVLKHRNIDQMFEAIRNLDKEGFEGIVRKIGDKGMKGIELADRFSAAIGWKGVFDEAVQAGATEEEAKAKADEVTLRTQPSARGADMAPAFRDANEWKKVLLMFGGPMNTIYNQIRFDLPQAVRDHEYGRAIGIATSYALAGVLLGAFAKGLGKDAPDSDEPWWKDWLVYGISQFSDSIPLVGGEITGLLKRIVGGDKRTWGNDSNFPAVQSMLDAIGSLTEGDLGKSAESLSEGIGMTLGLPTLAAKEYLKNIKSLIEGKE